MLTSAGYRLTVVHNGEKALDAYKAAPNEFDLILMDIQMPQMNGFDATREIRKLEGREGREDARRIPIIAMTAQTMKGDREKCLEVGMDDYISKPIRRETVFEMIKKWILKG
jgi:CheY-like chemotaxis protein